VCLVSLCVENGGIGFQSGLIRRMIMITFFSNDPGHWSSTVIYLGSQTDVRLLALIE